MMDGCEEIDLVLEATDGLGSLFIGNYAAASNPRTLAKLGIRAVVTVARGLLLPHPKEQLPNYLYLPIDDNAEQSLARYWPTVYDFIEKNRHKSNVLVHCYSGVSRSATFLAAYLMRKLKQSPEQALKQLRGRKRRINPNASFLKQLQIHHRELREIQVRDKQLLINKLELIKENSQHIEQQVQEIKEKLMQNEDRKRSKSEYLREKLEQKSASRKNSFCLETPPRNRSIKGHPLDIEMLKNTLSSLRSSIA